MRAMMASRPSHRTPWRSAVASGAKTACRSVELLRVERPRVGDGEVDDGLLVTGHALKILRITTCDGAPGNSSCSPGVNCQRLVHERRLESPTLRCHHDDVVVVAPVPSSWACASSRVRREELAVHVHFVVDLEDHDVGDVVGGRMVGIAEVAADLVESVEDAGRSYPGVVENGVVGEELVEPVPILGIDDVAVEPEQLVDLDDVGGVHVPLPEAGGVKLLSEKTIAAEEDADGQ